MRQLPGGGHSVWDYSQELAIYEFDGKRPEIDPSAYIAPTAVVIGDVRIRAEASIWWGAILRGDESYIEIGEGSNVQDGAMLHCTYQHPTLIGRHATVAHLCFLEGCVVEDGALVGNGAIVLNRARVCQGAMLAAGSVLAEGTEVPAGWLAAGVPAVVKKELSGSSANWIGSPAPHYRAHAKLYRERLKRID